MLKFEREWPVGTLFRCQQVSEGRKRSISRHNPRLAVTHSWTCRAIIGITVITVGVGSCSSEVGSLSSLGTTNNRNNQYLE